MLFNFLFHAFLAFFFTNFFLKVLGKAIGFDLTTITLPVTVNEPASFLMRLLEQMQYSDLLDKVFLKKKHTYFFLLFVITIIYPFH
jgi:hypothetical protein